MADSTVLIAAARNDQFAARVLFLSTKVAQMVSGEDPATPDSAVRKAYADVMIRGDDNPKMVATHVIASNPTIAASILAEPEKLGANIADNDIEFAISSIWTARAFAFEGREATRA